MMKITTLHLLDGHDEDFSTFRAVDTETDHLPVDIERNNWDTEALKRKDLEIAEAEALYKDHVTEGCRKLIDRFVIWKNFQNPDES